MRILNILPQLISLLSAGPGVEPEQAGAEYYDVGVFVPAVTGWIRHLQGAQGPQPPIYRWIIPFLGLNINTFLILP